jgi:hypothetical protein
VFDRPESGDRGSEGSQVPATAWSVADRVLDFARS